MYYHYGIEFLANNAALWSQEYTEPPAKRGKEWKKCFSTSRNS